MLVVEGKRGGGSEDQAHQTRSDYRRPNNVNRDGTMSDFSNYSFSPPGRPGAGADPVLPRLYSGVAGRYTFLVNISATTQH